LWELKPARADPIRASGAGLAPCSLHWATWATRTATGDAAAWTEVGVKWQSRDMDTMEQGKRKKKYIKEKKDKGKRKKCHL